MEKQRIIYAPSGVCASRMVIEMEGHTIAGVEVENGCDGNSQGLASLLKGMAAEEAVRKLEHIPCGRKSTSCPDQIAKALRQWLQSH